MIREKGFDTGRYLSAQVRRIMERVDQYDKLYLEFGGKLRYDHHASRVLPGFELDTKVQMLRKLGDQAEIVDCISAKDIERRKVRRDFGLTYEDQIIKDIGDLRELSLDVSAVVINRYEGEHAADKFRQRLENRGIRVYVHSEIEGYLTDVDRVVSEEGYGRPEHVETSGRIVVVTAPGPGSGKMSFCMGQVYRDRRRGVMSGFAKFETFPIWNLPLDHPVNVAYEAATADMGDYNCVDPWHREAYGVEAVNYNRDVENFAIMRRIIERLSGPGDPMAEIRSPTDMGVNMAREGIVDDGACREAAGEEIVRRFYQYRREFVEGLTTYDTLERMDAIMAKAGVKPGDREVAGAANAAMDEAATDPSKGYRGVHSGAAIEVWSGEGKLILTGKRSPLLHAESAALLNAVKSLGGIPDEINVLSPVIIESIVGLKRSLGLDESLDVKEVLDALAVSAVFNPNAAECIKALPQLRGCEMHSTHLMDGGCETPLKELGLNITTDARLPINNA
ncbi:MAG TPA: DUF1846 domain-containing protein [Candidatus Bathyarchaeia archaeon]